MKEALYIYREGRKKLENEIRKAGKLLIKNKNLKKKKKGRWSESLFLISVFQLMYQEQPNVKYCHQFFIGLWLRFYDNTNSFSF